MPINCHKLLNLVKTHFSKILPEYVNEIFGYPIRSLIPKAIMNSIVYQKIFFSELVEDETRRKLRSSQSNGVSSNDSETASTSSDDGIRFVVNVCDFRILLGFFWENIRENRCSGSVRKLISL